MTDFKLTAKLLDNKKIDKDFTQTIEVKETGIYAIFISARASAWWQNIPQFWRRFFKDDNLEVNLQGYPDKLSWNGNDLKKLLQTNVFVTPLNEGKYQLDFKVQQTPTITDLSVYQVSNTNNPDFVGLIPLIEDGDRRPLLKILYLNQDVKALSLKATVLPGRSHLLFLRDDDDLKIIVNGGTLKNSLPKAHTEWFWCGQAQSHQNSQERTLDLILATSTKCLLELFSDRTPKIESFKIDLSQRLLPKVFDKTFIIEDDTFVSLEMTETEIDNFLNSFGKANLKHIANLRFSGKTAADLIYEASSTNKINPKVLLTKLQAENGLLTGKNSQNPTSEMLNSALGVAVYDSGDIDQSFQGFVSQIQNAAKTFRLHYDNAADKKYIVPVVDGIENFKVKNRATYSLYRYTPHFAGAELFFDVYKELFEKNNQ